MASLKRVNLADSAALIEGGATPELMGALGAFAKNNSTLIDLVNGGLVDDRLLVVQFVEDGNYPLWRNVPYGFEIESVTTDCTSGTCTATVKINGVAIGGTANSVSTTETTQAHTTDNAVVIGDDVIVTIASNSGCEGMELSVKYRRPFFV